MIERHVVKSRSFRSRLLSGFLRVSVKPVLTSKYYSPTRSRARLERVMGRRQAATGVTVEAVDGSATKGEWQMPANVSCGVVLYLHGGGYMVGSPKVYRSVTTRLAHLSGARIFSLDYRLAPEHPFPAAVEDAIAAYHWLLNQQLDPAKLALAGDSAGGGLSLALIHALKKEQLPLPAGVFLFSPYADLLATGRSTEENSQRCAMFNGPAVLRAAEIYLQGQDGTSALASPLYGDFSGFPPLWIYVSDSEVVRDDGVRIAEKADAAGVNVRLNMWHGQPHAWPAFYPLLPEANRCLEEVASAVRHLSQPGTR